jgi:hypothetical protein
MDTVGDEMCVTWDSVQTPPGTYARPIRYLTWARARARYLGPGPTGTHRLREKALGIYTR